MRMSMREHVVELRADDQPPIVIVVDDDPGVRDSLGKLLRSAGFRVNLLGSVSEFLAADRPEGPACLVLDVRLPGQSGLELQRELDDRFLGSNHIQAASASL
jgi:FixJ family two-component response regulator